MLNYVFTCSCCSYCEVLRRYFQGDEPVFLNIHWEQVQTASLASWVQDVTVCLKASLVFVWFIHKDYNKTCCAPFVSLWSSFRQILLGLCKSLSVNPCRSAQSQLIREWHAVGLRNVMTRSTSSLALSRCSKLYYEQHQSFLWEKVWTATSTKTLDLLWKLKLFIV